MATPPKEMKTKTKERQLFRSFLNTYMARGASNVKDSAISKQTVRTEGAPLELYHTQA